MAVKTAAEIYRDFTEPGNPLAGPWLPPKPDIREWGTDKEARLTSVEALIGSGSGSTDVLQKIAALQPEIGSITSALVPIPTYANGALPFVLDGRTIGMTVPAGQTGLGSVMEFSLPLPKSVGDKLPFRNIHVRLVLPHGPDYTGVLTPGLNAIGRDGLAMAVGLANVTNVDNALGQRVIAFDGLIPSLSAGGGLAGLSFTVTLGANNAGATVLLGEAILSVTQSPTNYYSPAQENLESLYLRAIDAATPSSGVGMAECSVTVLAGAAGLIFRYDASGRLIGFGIPAGATGGNSVIQAKAAVSAAVASLLVGCVVECSFLFKVSAGYGPATRPLGFVFDIGETLAGIRTRDQLLAGGLRIVTIQATITSAILASRLFQPCVVTASTAPAQAGGEFIELADIAFRVIGTNDSLRNAASVNATWLAARVSERGTPGLVQSSTAPLVDRLRQNAYATTATGTPINTLIAGAPSPSAFNRSVVNVAAGAYAQNNVVGNFAGFVDLVGRTSGRVVVDGTLPASTDPATIANQSTFEWFWTGDIEDLSIVARNKRYAVHTDLPTAPVTPTAVTLRWAHLEHQGNADAQAYQNAQGTGVTIWPSTYAWGVGCWSSWLLRSEFSSFHGEVGAVAIHNNLGFTAPARMELIGSRLAARADAGYAMGTQALGSGQADKLVLMGNSLMGQSRVAAPLWFPTEAARQPADHTEFRWRGFANTPSAFVSEDWGLALRLASANTTAASSVAVSGSAVASLFGRGAGDPTPDLPLFTVAAGGGGLPATLTGWGDRSGHTVGPTDAVLAPTLGSMLGNCTATPKTLAVSFQGAAAITVTFNQNHTGQSNATVLGLINAALGANGTASLFAPGLRFRPSITDEEYPRKNLGAAAIRMGAPCAYMTDGSRAVRPMTSADPAYLFAGLAWEDIVPGAVGRVKFRGFVHIQDLQLAGLTGTLALGALVGVGAVAGTWQVGAAIPLMRGLSADTASFALGPSASDSAAITGGTIDGAAIGVTTRAAGAFSRLGVAGPATSGAEATIAAANAPWGASGQGLALLLNTTTWHAAMGFADYFGSNWFGLGNSVGTWRLDRMPAPGTTAVAPVPLLGVTQAGELQMGSALATVVDANRVLYARPYTVATLPAGTNGAIVFASNGRKVGEAAGAGTGALAVYSNSSWRRLSDDTALTA